MLAVRHLRRLAHAAPASQETLLSVLQKRHPGSDVSHRLAQLKRNHMQYLALDINWNTYKPEEQQEMLRDLDDLVKDSYAVWTPEQKQACTTYDSLLISYS